MRPLTTGLVVVLAGILFAAWFFSSHEKVEVEEWVGYRGDARVNPWLAAELLVRELGFESESKPELTPAEWLPPETDTLIVQVTSSLGVGSDLYLLLNWAGEGGHLVLLGPEFVAEEGDDTLWQFGIGLRVTRSKLYEAKEAQDDFEDELDGDYALGTYPHDARLEVVNEEQGFDVISHGGEIIAARQQWGDGFVSVVANATRFDNDSINNGDNARLFADVVMGEIEPGKIWLIFRTRLTPLWQLIWQAAPYLVISAALIVLLLLWSALPAFGPRIVAQTDERRSILEHIHASGLFVWRHAGRFSLRESSTGALLREADTRHPGLSRLARTKQAEAIARITGQSAQWVLDVLTGSEEKGQRGFTQDIQRIQEIRKEL
ncbi:MAG: DUF4350 domain-containing protein [Woeseiaceae bacterium]|nr:DUF4350 domain-containing protein [Gammaproteobacteria bacterium]NNF49257.1 DUF4350 domain-containing protein [Woeseiaceae bacterium]NNK24081.1 DUF4350 domain-containing protein [Woeseiaceae bacterium]